MVKFMKSWCEDIIIAIIISIIIELLIPDGNNKKYVKVVVGIFLIFVILNPVLEKVNFDFEIENVFKQEIVEISANLNKDIKEVYVDGIENTIKSQLEEKGYFVKNVKVIVDNNYENIEKIEVEILKNENNETLNQDKNQRINEIEDMKEIKIEQITIGKNKIEDEDNIELKNFISENYQVAINQIYILEN